MSEAKRLIEAVRSGADPMRVANEAVTEGKLPPGAPKQVAAVFKALQKNALEAAEEQIKELARMGTPDKDPEGTRKFWKDAPYVSNTDSRGQRTDRWVISDNYERGANLVYRADVDQWYYMPNYGSERPMKGGFQEALSSAEIYYTG